MGSTRTLIAGSELAQQTSRTKKILTDLLTALQLNARTGTSFLFFQGRMLPFGTLPTHHFINDVLRNSGSSLRAFIADNAGHKFCVVGEASETFVEGIHLLVFDREIASSRNLHSGYSTQGGRLMVSRRVLGEIFVAYQEMSRGRNCPD